MNARPMIVGEANPYGGDPRFALYPRPRGAAGYRLCSYVLGLAALDYLARFDRINLCPEEWHGPTAREHAAEIKASAPHGRWHVLLGARVAKAFGATSATARNPVKVYGWLNGGGLVAIPHPSGRCRLWNDNIVERVRDKLRELGVLAEQARP